MAAGEHLGNLGWVGQVVHHGAGTSVGHNLVLIDDEMDQLRTAAAAGQVSLRAFVQRAALDAASDHKRRVREAARMVAERSAELNRRLA